MTKRLFSLVLAVVLAALLFAACGKRVQSVVPPYSADAPEITVSAEESEEEIIEKPDEPAKPEGPESEAGRFFDAYLAGEWWTNGGDPVFLNEDFQYYGGELPEFNLFDFGGMFRSYGFYSFLSGYYELRGDSLEDHYFSYEWGMDNTAAGIDPDTLVYIDQVCSEGNLDDLVNAGVITPDDAARMNRDDAFMWNSFVLVKESALQDAADSFYGEDNDIDVIRGADFVTDTGFVVFNFIAGGGYSEPYYFRLDSVVCDGDAAYLKISLIRERALDYPYVYLTDELSGEVRYVYENGEDIPFIDYGTFLKFMENESFETFTAELRKENDGYCMKNVVTDSTGDYYTVPYSAEAKLEPSAESETAGLLPVGSVIRIDENENGFGKIRYTGLDCWVDLDQLSEGVYSMYE